MRKVIPKNGTLFLTALGNALLLLIGLSDSACSFSNRENAQLAGQSQRDAAGDEEDSSSLLSSSSSSSGTNPEYPSNLVRSSGDVIFFRLSKLFPAALTANYLKASDFDSETSTGLNKPIAQESRPSSALALVALRKFSAKLCKTYIGAPGGAEGTLFSTSGITVSGETSPSHEEERLVWAAARNGWLDLYEVQSPEAQELLRLYRAVKAKAGSTESLARQTLCMAILNAPQFTLGNVGPRDPVRRVSLELGRKLPRFQDLDDYQKGKLTIEAIVSEIQEDRNEDSGYRSAVKKWHRDWWGLREFRSKQSGAYHTTDPRGNGAYFWSWSEPGSTYMVSRHVFPDGHSLVDPAGLYLHQNPPNSMLGCEYENSDRSAALQEFDPRTTLVVAEHQHPDHPERWEVVGGWVHEDRLSEYQALIGTYHSSFSAHSNCTLISSSDPKYKEGDPLYYRCNGSVSSKEGGFLTSSMKDFYGMGTAVTTSGGKATGRFTYPESHFLIQAQSNPGDPLHTNVLAQSVHSEYTHSTRRIRRKSPSGWQTGVSRLKTWWSGDSVYVCNGFERFAVSCPLRISTPGRPGYDAHTSWLASNTTLGYTPDGEYVVSGSYHPLFYSVAPMVLNRYRCGIPDVQELPSALSTAISEDRVYPRGFTFDDSSYLATPFRPTHSIIQTTLLGETMGDLAPGETAAITRVQEDLAEEPYRLINKVLNEKASYATLLTANYTLGREELELAYRSQFLTLPAYPPGYTLPDPTASSREQVRIIKRGELPSIPLSWMRGPYAGGNHDYYTDSSKAKASGQISPAPASGILTMPAFLGPVSGKMRTVSARFFERLLCAQPNLYQPTGSELTLHQTYMTDSRNPAPAQHLNQKTSCFSCHVNLDPLAAALSGTFLQYVQKDEKKAKNGQFLIVEPFAFSSSGFLGGRGNSETGEGALLGKPARGFVEVGAILAESPEFYRCTVSRAFEKVLGRAPLAGDTSGFNKISNDFFQHRDFDRMIRDIVKSRSYQREN